MVEPDSILVSSFNEAVAKANRIGLLQVDINRFKLNPLASNDEFKEVNYILWFRSVKSLYGEARDKCTEKEILKGDAIRKFLEELIDDRSPFKKIRSVSKKDNYSVDKTFWKLLREMITEFEDYTKKLLEVHGYGAPNKMDIGSAVTQMN